MIHIVLSQNFHQSLKDNKARPKLSAQGFFINFHQKLVFYFCFKNLLKNLNQGQGKIRVDTCCPFRKALLTFHEVSGLCVWWFQFHMNELVTLSYWLWFKFVTPRRVYIASARVGSGSITLIKKQKKMEKGARKTGQKMLQC